MTNTPIAHIATVRTTFTILISFLALFALPSLSIPAQEHENLDAAIEKIKNNLNQDPSLFQKYSSSRYGLSASFSLVDYARLDGDHLLNPNGGRLELTGLSHLPRLGRVEMLPQGGFRLHYSPPSTLSQTSAPVTIQGFNQLSANEQGLSIDGMLVLPRGALHLKKTSTGIFARGIGSLLINEKQFGIQSLQQDMVFGISSQGVESVRIPASKGFLNSLKYLGHELQPQDADVTLYTHPGLYNQAEGNKVYAGQAPNEKVLVSQESGRLLIDRYYHFSNGNLGVVRRAFLTGPPPSPVAYTFQSKTLQVVGAIPPEQTSGYRSIADLFGAYGYGSGSENKAARRAYYEKYIGPGYRGTSSQNSQLLSKIQHGEIPLFPAGEKRFDIVFNPSQNPSQGSLEATARISNGASGTRATPVREASISVSSERRNTPLIRTTLPHASPSFSPTGRLELNSQPPEGIRPVQGKVTFYYTPVFDPTESAQANKPLSPGPFPTRESEKTWDGFLIKVRREGSGIYLNEDDNRWYHRSYTGQDSILSDKNRFGMTSSGKTPFIGMLAAPKGIPLGSTAYVETESGDYARFYVGDRGGAIVKTGDTYKIDIWAGVGLPSIQTAEKTTSISGIRLSKNPKIYFVPPNR